MDESKATSEFVYEDEYSFLTESNELFLKEGSHTPKRKLCDVKEGELEAKVEEMKTAFSKLEQQVESLRNKDEPASGEVESLRKSLDEAQAIGDYDVLYKQLADLDEAGQDDDDEATAKKEDLTEISADGQANAETAEEVGESATESVQQNSEEDAEADGDGEDTIAFYRDIVKKADDLAKQTDWSYVSMELDNLSHKWSEGPDLDGEDVGKLYQKFTSKVDDFEKRKKEHYEKLKKQRKENLARKKKLLAQLKDIVEEKKWTATGKVGSIKNKWNSVGSLPSGEGEGFDEQFEKLVSTFNDHKVDRLVQQRQKEEDNLMIKLIVLDKMENVAGSIDENTESWKKIEDDFDDLTNQWKKIGRVPKEKSNEVWQRYKNAQDAYYDKKYKFDKEHQSWVDKFKSKKEKIIQEAEALLNDEDLASAARKINKLHRRWKKAGNLPQRLEDKLWNRFKSATDAFNERKSNNADKLHKQEEEHYKEKLGLIDQAESIKDTTEWDKGHKKMQSLMDKWKAVGPVPRKKSNKIWKKFKGAMDIFYDRRRDHFKEVKEERKDNLDEKKEILEKLKDLGQHEDPIEAVSIAKKLQAEFKDAGYVPIKKKNKIWKQYREACDVIYDRFRAAKSGDKFDQELAKANLDSDDRSKIQSMRKKYKKIKKEVRQLEEEVIKYQETKTYFKPSKKGNSLLDEVEQKIETAEEKLQDKQDKLDSISREMEEIRDEA